MGGRQASRRFKLQQEMAVRGDEGQKAVARLEIAKQLRACELGAMRTHTLQKIQHPLAPAGHQSKAEADGWRHLPHDPAQPIELAAELAAEEEPPPMYKRGSVLPESLNETLEQRHRRTSTARRQSRRESRAKPTPTMAAWLDGRRASVTSAAPFWDRAVAPGRQFKDAESPRVYVDEMGHEHELPPSHLAHLAAHSPGADTIDEDAAYHDHSFNHHEYAHDPYHHKKPSTAPANVERYTGQFRHFHLDDLYAASGPGGGSIPAITAMYGPPPEEPLQPTPPDLITPATFGGGASSARVRRTYHYLEPKSTGSRSARTRREIKREEPADEPLRLPDDECDRLFAAAARLPAYKRVKERLRLLREQPHLQEAVQQRAQKHRDAMQASLAVDFVSLNMAQQNFTPEAQEKRDKKLAASRRLRDARTTRALEIVASGGDKSSLSSEILTNARAHRRRKDLLRGMAAFVSEREAERARRWATLVQLARATSTMRGIAKLACLVKRIRTTSRVSWAVRRVQRAFRARKVARDGMLRLTQILSIQRIARRWLMRKRVQQYGESVAIVSSFLRGCSRLTPMEMAIKRFSMRVRVMQRFIRGYQAVTRGKLILLGLQWKRVEMARLVDEYGKPTRTLDGAYVTKQRGPIKKAGQYAGVPEDMLDLPLPHVPEAVRVSTLKQLLHDTRRKYVHDMILWDQKVLLKAETHPSLIGGERGVQRLAVIQNDIAKDRSLNRRTSKFGSVMAIFDNMTLVPEGDSSHRVTGPPRSSPKDSLTHKLKKLNTSLSAQRAALDEIRRTIPRPFLRSLVPRETMQAAFEKAVHECTMSDTFEMRPIRTARKKAAAPSASALAQRPEKA